MTDDATSRDRAAGPGTGPGADTGPVAEAESAAGSAAGTGDAAARPAGPRPRHHGSVLMAAMLGLADALGMEPKPDPIEVAQPATPDGEGGLELGYGPLRPLDD